VQSHPRARALRLRLELAAAHAKTATRVIKEILPFPPSFPDQLESYYEQPTAAAKKHHARAAVSASPLVLAQQSNSKAFSKRFRFLNAE